MASYSYLFGYPARKKRRQADKKTAKTKVDGDVVSLLTDLGVKPTSIALLRKYGLLKPKVVGKTSLSGSILKKIVSGGEGVVVVLEGTRIKVVIDRPLTEIVESYGERGLEHAFATARELEKFGDVIIDTANDRVVARSRSSFVEYDGSRFKGVFSDVGEVEKVTGALERVSRAFGSDESIFRDNLSSTLSAVREVTSRVGGMIAKIEVELAKGKSKIGVLFTNGKDSVKIELNPDKLVSKEEVKKYVAKVLVDSGFITRETFNKIVFGKAEPEENEKRKNIPKPKLTLPKI